MEDSKTLLFYLFGLVGLITIAILFTGQIEPPAVEPLPATRTPTVEKIKSTPILPEVDQTACSVADQKIVFYKTDTLTLADDPLVIFGMVYASDFVTPLSDVLIEIWRTPPKNQYQPSLPDTPPHYLFDVWTRTDAAGRYEVTIQRPDRDDLIHLYYRVRYQNRCPLTLQLFLVDEPAQAHPSSTAFLLMKQVPHAPLPASSPLPTEFELAQGEVGGLLLRGPVDIVLPIPPPEFNSK